MRRHPKAEKLALYAGGDLPLAERVALALHLRFCAHCREEAGRFLRARQAFREEAAALPPGLDWGALEAEMRANIRLGVAAGAIVGGRPRRARSWEPPWKPAFVVTATLAVVMAAGWMLERSRMPAPAAGPGGEVVLRSTPEGLAVEWSSNEAAVFGAGRTPVAAAVNWDGSARAPFLDDETGQVTIYNVAAQ
ncbi:MAG: hypothetical protein N2036_03840 [Bryobacteraceae bacterium]|nr:hypothetical protein [Bryobacteraceae bacterium]MCX7603186.1 hypothetical protein [Bryobacteraceae bacterium]